MKRSWFEQYLVQASYNAVTLLAVANGTLDYALEQAVENQLELESSAGIFQKDALDLVVRYGSFRQAAAAIIDKHPKHDPWRTMQIISPMPFVLTPEFMIGIASDGTLAAQMWRISDPAINVISGNNFSWWGPDGEEYVDDKHIFSRPTEQQIRAFITPSLLKKGIELGLLQFEKDEKEANI